MDNVKGGRGGESELRLRSRLWLGSELGSGLIKVGVKLRVS